MRFELVGSFAAQAVIAIENTRLLNELRESLQQQTATSDVLSIISSSPGELQPVFHGILANATRICDAFQGSMVLREADTYRIVAQHGGSSELTYQRQREPVVTRGSGTMLDNISKTKQPAQIADLATSPELAPALAKLGGARSILMAPMLKDNEMIGAIGIYRQEVRPFTDKQIELVKNFAAQAIIAIENTRLLNELRQRTDDLSEALEQQTATSEVLQVISGSPGELEPVFRAMLENTLRICEAQFGQMFLGEHDAVRLVAHIGVPTALVEFDKGRGAFHPVPGGPLEYVFRARQTIHVKDMASKYAEYPPVKLGGARSYIAVPMLKENQLIGAICIYRQEVRPFTDKQIILVESFAKQAVIAVENTRLLNELRQRTDDLSEALERQT